MNENTKTTEENALTTIILAIYQLKTRMKMNKIKINLDSFQVVLLYKRPLSIVVVNSTAANRYVQLRGFYIASDHFNTMWEKLSFFTRSFHAIIFVIVCAIRKYHKMNMIVGNDI